MDGYLALFSDRKMKRYMEGFRELDTALLCVGRLLGSAFCGGWLVDGNEEVGLNCPRDLARRDLHLLGIVFCIWKKYYWVSLVGVVGRLKEVSRALFSDINRNIN